MNVLYEDTNRLDCDEAHDYLIKLIPFARLKNLLPYQVEFYYEPGPEDAVMLEPGDETYLTYAMFGFSRK